jgi:hypothetical protein
METMIDIVIPFQHSINKDREIVFALRSIAKYNEIRDVYVVGDEPMTLKDVKHIPFSQSKISAFRDRNMYQKILLATTHCSEEFMIVHDDNFLLKPLRGYYHQGRTWRGAPDTDYRQLEQNTRQLWNNTLNYDVHAPHIVTVDGFRKLQQLDWDVPHGYGVKTAYANLNKVDDAVEVVDCKIGGQYEVPEIKRIITNRLFFSISDTAFKPAMIQVLNELYPDKSKWEV